MANFSWWIFSLIEVFEHGSSTHHRQAHNCFSFFFFRSLTVVETGDFHGGPISEVFVSRRCPSQIIVIIKFEPRHNVFVRCQGVRATYVTTK